MSSRNSKALVVAAAFLTMLIIVGVYRMNQPVYVSYTAIGLSMEPTIHNGCTVIVQANFPADQIVAGSHIEMTGDIIVYNATIFPMYDCLVLHRVIAIYSWHGEYWFQTQGDNNPYVDPLSWNEYTEHFGFTESKPGWWGVGWVIDDLYLGKFIEVATP